MGPVKRFYIATSPFIFYLMSVVKTNLVEDEDVSDLGLAAAAAAAAVAVQPAQPAHGPDPGGRRHGRHSAAIVVALHLKF